MTPSSTGAPRRLLAPLRFCPGPGCHARVREGRCPVCKAKGEQQRGNFRQRLGGLYDARWDVASRAFRRNYPLCGMRPNGLKPVMSKCYDAGIVTPAYQTDHVIPVHQRPDLFWASDENWQALCRACGAAKSQAGL